MGYHCEANIGVDCFIMVVIKKWKELDCQYHTLCAWRTQIPHCLCSMASIYPCNPSRNHPSVFPYSSRIWPQCHEVPRGDIYVSRILFWQEGAMSSSIRSGRMGWGWPWRRDKRRKPLAMGVSGHQWADTYSSRAFSSLCQTPTPMKRYHLSHPL
jgi:hypothetical protein